MRQNSSRSEVAGWERGRIAAGDRPTRGNRPQPAGNLFFDLRTATLMREHGFRTLYTADADFHRFKELEILNPLHPAA